MYDIIVVYFTIRAKMKNKYYRWNIWLEMHNILNELTLFQLSNLYDIYVNPFCHTFAVIIPFGNHYFHECSLILSYQNIPYLNLCYNSMYHLILKIVTLSFLTLNRSFFMVVNQCWNFNNKIEFSFLYSVFMVEFCAIFIQNISRVNFVSCISSFFSR